MKTISKSSIYLFLILLLGAFLRLYLLGTIPQGISNDEATIAYSAYSIWHTGRDIAGQFLPLSINLGNSFSPVYIYFTAPFVGLLGLSAFSARLPFALISAATILLLYFLTKTVTKNTSIALFSSLLFALSPWDLTLSRAGGLDAIFAVFFYLLSLLIFTVYVEKKSWKFLLSLIPFLLAFYSYHATKIFFLFLVPFLLIYYRKTLWQRKIQTLLFFIGSLCIFISFIFVSQAQHVNRQEVLLWSNSINAAKQVNYERQYNNAPRMLQNAFSNKFIYYSKAIFQNYLEVFSPQYLFLYGDQSDGKLQFSMLDMGQLYLFELPFLLLGIWVVWKNKKSHLFLWLLILTPLPATFTIDRSYTSRGLLLLPFLEILAGSGIWAFLMWLTKQSRNRRVLLLAFILSLSAFCIGEYFYTYYYRAPFFAAEAWKVSTKEAAQFAISHHSEYKKIYFDRTDEIFILQYAILDRADPNTIQQLWSGKINHIDNVYFVRYCNPSKASTLQNVYSEKNILILTDDTCRYINTPKQTIVDKGEVLSTRWRIYAQ